MGTELDVSVIAEENPEVKFVYIEYLMQRYEDMFSRFKKNSEVGRLNVEKESIVSLEFIKVLKMAKEIYTFTEGLINPLCTPKYLGYEYSFQELKDHNLQTEIFGDTRLEEIEIDEKTRRVRLKEDQNLDFGGILKGYLAELVSNYLSDFDGVIVNLGGDIFCKGLDLGDKKFAFALLNPLDPEKSLGTFTPFNQALTTSSVVRRSWEIGGEKFNHIVDPRTKKSVSNNVLSVSVIFDQGIYADALAKLGLILGVEEGLNYYEKNNIPALFVLDNLEIVRTSQMNKYFLL